MSGTACVSDDHTVGTVALPALRRPRQGLGHQWDRQPWNWIGSSGNSNRLATVANLVWCSAGPRTAGPAAVRGLYGRVGSSAGRPRCRAGARVRGVGRHGHGPGDGCRRAGTPGIYRARGRIWATAKLLWVCAADVTPGRVGSVEQLSDSLLRGVIDRFAPYESMADIHHDAWFEICAAAVRMAGASTVSDDANRTISVASLRDLVKRAVLDPSIARIRGVSILAPTGAYTRAKPILQDTACLDPWRRDAFSGYHADQRQGFDEILKVVLESALVTSHGAVITQDGHLLSESCSGIPGKRLGTLRVDGSQRQKIPTVGPLQAQCA